MNYSDEFKCLVSKSNPDNHNEYIGKGNPNAKILIIGKELALDPKKDNHVIEKTSKQNVSDWKDNIKNIDKKIENCEDNNIETIHLFNPLFPYKGMKKLQQSVGHTWRGYQLLHDKILCQQSEKHNEYKFYDNIFITELNSNPTKYSKDQDKIERRKSITERISNPGLFNSNFIKAFPIVVVACGDYPKQNNVNLCELFNVDFITPIKKVEGLKITQWYNLHKNKIGEKPKLLIHTRQLSNGVLNELLEQIANEIKSFAEENKIEL